MHYILLGHRCLYLPELSRPAIANAEKVRIRIRRSGKRMCDRHDSNLPCCKVVIECDRGAAEISSLGVSAV